MDRTGKTTRERLRALLLMLPLVGLALAIWACSAGSRAIPPPVTHLPASQLRVLIQFEGQYDNSPNVQVVIHFYEAATSKEVSVADKARLTCNGSDVKPNFTGAGLMRLCQRQPPGGAYRITYTDEHGVATTMVIPVPSGRFTILSPLAGSTVKIPTNSALTVRYAIPIAPPKSSVSIISVIAWCATSGYSCDSVMYIPVSSFSTPTPGFGIPTATPIEHGGSPTPTPSSSKPTATVFENRGPATPTPGGNGGTTTSPGTIVTQSDGMGTVVLSGNFFAYQPGPGKIEIFITAQIAPDLGGFAAARVTMYGSVRANITWVR